MIITPHSLISSDYLKVYDLINNELLENVTSIDTATGIIKTANLINGKLEYKDYPNKVRVEISMV